MTHHTRFLTLGYFVAAGLTGSSPSASAQDRERPAITVLVYNHAAVALDTLARAEAQAAAIFGQAGVDIVWADPATDSRYSAISPTSNSLGTFTVQMVVRAHATGPAVRGESEMGRALGGGTETGGVARLFYDRVTTVAHERRRNVSDVLGWAMAHEMGHLLLPYPSHSATGIMTAEWNADAFRHATDGALSFTPSQAALIRSRCRMAVPGPQSPVPSP